MKVLAGDDGRIFQLLDGGGGEGGGASRRGHGPCRGALGLERGAHAPPRRHFQRGLDGDIAPRYMRRIEEQLFPLQYGKFLRQARGDDAIEVGVQSGHARRNGDVKLVHIHVIAPPRDRLAIDGEDYAGDCKLGDIAGEPHRIDWADLLPVEFKPYRGLAVGSLPLCVLRKGPGECGWAEVTGARVR